MGPLLGSFRDVGEEGNSRGVCVYGSLGSRVCLRSSLVPCLSRLPCPVPPFSSFSPLSPFSLPSFSPLSPFFLPSNGHNVRLSEGEERPKSSRGTVISRACGASSASHGVKSHFPRSWRNLPHSGSDSRSRSPLSIRALRSARNRREGRRTNLPLQNLPIGASLRAPGPG